MNSKHMWSVVRIIGVLVLATAIGAVCQAPQNNNFRGIINDHTGVIGGGPWEVHGEWTLTLKGTSGKADFSAVLTMEKSDYWVWMTASDPSNTALRTAHTHHLMMKDAQVTPISGGFRLTGPVTVTGNGNVPPFGTSSSLQVDVTGGSIVTYSNVALTFSGDAAGHFGTSPLHGAVSDSK